MNKSRKELLEDYRKKFLEEPKTESGKKLLEEPQKDFMDESQ